MTTWTQDESISYECAREAITHMRAIVFSQIYEEENKPTPDLERLTSLNAEHNRLFQERKSLRLKDHAKIAHVRAHYGKIIRASYYRKKASGALA